MAEEVIILL